MQFRGGHQYALFLELFSALFAKFGQRQSENMVSICIKTHFALLSCDTFLSTIHLFFPRMLITFLGLSHIYFVSFVTTSDDCGFRSFLLPMRFYSWFSALNSCFSILRVINTLWVLPIHSLWIMRFSLINFLMTYKFSL